MAWAHVPRYSSLSKVLVKLFCDNVTLVSGHCKDVLLDGRFVTAVADEYATRWIEDEAVTDWYEKGKICSFHEHGDASVCPLNSE